MVLTRTPKRLINLGIGAVLLAILGIGVLSWASMREVATTSGDVARTQAIVERVQNVGDMASKALRAQRSYVLSGDPAARRLYAETVRRIGPLVDALDADFAAASPQSQRLLQFRQRFDVSARRMDETVRTYETLGPDAARAMLVQDATMGLERALDVLGEIEHDERTQLAGRTAAADATQRQASLVTLLSSALTFLFLFSGGVLLNRALRRRDQAQDLLQESQSRFATLIDTAGSVIVAVDETGNVTTFNREAERLSGLAAADVLGRPVADAFAPTSGIADFDALVQRALYGEDVHNHDTVLLQTNGQPHALMWNVRPLLDAEGVLTGALAAGTEITARKNAETRLHFDAFHDALTGLLNRRALRDALVRAVGAGQTGTVLLLDLDGFKAVNDTHGHEAGDALLKEIGLRLRRCVRAQDILARLGGDEFAVVLLHADTEATAEVARRILTSINQPIAVGSVWVSVSASIGGAELHGEGDDVGELLREADIAMYRAKALGRNRFVGADVMASPEEERRRRLDLDLPGAVGRGELRLQYQPLVHLQTGQIAGLEALVRWQHPTLGLVPPGDFIPAAVAAGLTPDIGAWVLTTACREVQAWGPHLTPGLLLLLAVNFARDQFLAPDTVVQLRQVLRATGLAPGQLVVEITEQVLEQEEPAIFAMLDEMRELGVQIALDDFGTGFTALATLGRLPLNLLKLDRGFVRDLAPSGPVFEVMRAVIDLAHRLGLRVVAEGIETKEHASLLYQLGCDFGQGFYFSRPIDAASALALVQASQTGTAWS